MMLSVPLVPYCEDERKILQEETFVLLLQKLGLHLGSGVCQMYPRIPLYWTTDMLFSIACRLGPISKGIVWLYINVFALLSFAQIYF